jgi:hypothetical protein
MLWVDRHYGWYHSGKTECGGFAGQTPSGSLCTADGYDSVGWLMKTTSLHR